MTDTLDGLLSSLGRASWQGTLAFLFVWLLCRVLARRLTADAHCWLWRLGYVKLLVGLLWGGTLLMPLLSPTPRPAQTQSSPASVAYRYPAEQSGAGAGADLPISVGPVARPRLGWQVGLAAVYVFGVALCLGRLLRAAGRTQRIVRLAALNVTERETACAARLARDMGLRHIPALARSAEVSSPVLIAGRVLLPSEAQYGEDELRMILAHELAHARRRDLLWEWLGTLVQVVFFFHPLVVVARREERLAREAAADALALKTTGAAAADYGKLLLSLSLGHAGPRPALAGAVGVIEGGSPMRRRLLALRDGAARTDARRNRWRLAVALVPLLALVFVPWQVTHGQAQPPAALPAVSVPNGSPSMPAGDKRIVGVVRDQAGKPVAGISIGLVWVTNTESTLAGQAVTDAHGRFAFFHLPAGKFDCEVSPEGGQDPSGAYVPLTVPLDVPITIRANVLEKDLSLVAATGSLIKGRVVDGQTGDPISGVCVNAGPVPPGSVPTDWAAWSGASNGRTDAQGRYQVRVMPGDVFVRVEQTMGGTALSNRVRQAERTARAQFGQLASVPDIPVSFYPVIVFTGPDGRPVANATVNITPKNFAKGGYILGDRTDPLGSVVLSTFQSGIFRTSQKGLYLSGVFQWSPGQPLVIEENGQTLSFPDGVGRVQLTAEATAVVVGHVVSGDAEPISDAVVAVYETDPKSHYGLGNHFFRTDASGDFGAPLDLDGQYHVYIRANGFNQVMVSHDPLPLVKSQTTDLGTIRLVDARGFVAGRIVDPQETPMPGILASVRGDQTGNSAALTDAQGRFRIPNVVPGEALRLTLCLKGELVNGDSGSAAFQSNEQMDFSGVQASPTEREIVWHPRPGGY